MSFSVNIYSNKKGEIRRFLEEFYSKKLILDNELSWNKDFDSPFDIIDLISCFIDNKDSFELNIWISLDKNVFIAITENNINELIKYIYERYPY
ncbi:MAG: hypothetical protein ACI4UE_01495 [Candidatus Scatovivens sp.]